MAHHPIVEVNETHRSIRKMLIDTNIDAKEILADLKTILILLPKFLSIKNGEAKKINLNQGETITPTPVIGTEREQPAVPLPPIPLPPVPQIIIAIDSLVSIKNIYFSVYTLTSHI